MNQKRKHTSVMLEECLKGFEGCHLPVFFEGTVGAGGHAEAILSAHPEIERYIACDQDPEALELAKERLTPWKDKVEFVRANFKDLDEVLKARNVEWVNGFFFDFGVSSMQLDQGEKGFSFMREGPLDMRMDPDGQLTAKEVVNSYSEKKLGEIFQTVGEEPHWRKAARAIISARKNKPIETTQELSCLMTEALAFKRGGKLHPATLVFQALRIVVNQELEAIEIGLKKALDFLTPQGRVGTIAFHSLEDRIVKNMFRSACFKPKSKAGKGFLNLLTKKPWMPSFKEAKKNPRSRSAKMRFAEKIAAL
ncbi:MAG: 16S rRNA (cytosine(1402)-N(4))-methyltransferase RsmH [Candidatus Rhabdochlamydia sp.]